MTGRPKVWTEDKLNQVKYLVNVWSEETYKKVFTANSKEEAEEKAREEIDEGDGVDFKNGWKTGYNADYGITDVEEVK